MGNCLDRSVSEDDEMPIRRDEHNHSTNVINNTNEYVNTAATTNNNNNNSLPPPYYQTNRSNYMLRNANALQNISNGNSPTPQQQPVFYITPSVQRTADQLTEEEQIKLLKRMALIQQLPSGTYDESKKNKECVICMIDFETDDKIKFLPCLHTFHQSCIDTWLLRSLICPSCMEPVDAGLLSAYDN